MDGLQCLHYDAHVHTNVIDKMKEGDRTFKAIMNYVVRKFQELLKDQFILHKRTIKFLKKKKYKDWKGSEAQRVYPYILPKDYD